MITLVEFLRARLDEDEREIRSVLQPAGPDLQLSNSHRAMHMVLTHQLEADWPTGTPRMFVDIEAKRRIVDEHYPVYAPKACRRCSDFAAPGEILHAEPGPCLTLRLLALPYADHPSYREEWRP